MDISRFQNNALVKKIGIRDYRLENTPASAMTLPYSFSLRNKITDIKDQGSSSSCVAQATAYYVQLLNYIETTGQVPMSARDVYSLIFQPEGGAYIADACKKVCNSGCVPEIDATSYYNGQPPTESFMRLRSDINPKFQNDGMEYLAKKYVTWDNTNLDLYKQAIIQGNGMVAVTWGNNYCWGTGVKNGVILLPDDKTQMAWRHGLYFCGYFTISDADDELVKQGLMTMDEARDRYTKGISK
jgi:hypothetical protein